MIKKNTESLELNFKFREFESVDELAEQYSSARTAFDSGNYEFASFLSHKENNLVMSAISQIMCGMVESGLRNLTSLLKDDDLANLIQVFALWVLDRNQEALDLLRNCSFGSWDFEARRLSKIILKPDLRVVVYHNQDSLLSAPLAPGRGIEVKTIDINSREYLENSQIRWNFDEIDLVICLNTIPKDLHDRVAMFECPVVTVASDFDMNISRHAPLLSRSDCILVGTSYEHFHLNSLYDARVACFPGMRLRDRKKLEQSHVEDTKYDICFSGRAFKSYWPDKARILFHIASIDNPSLRIKIYDGFLDTETYSDLLRSSQYNILPNRYGFSLMHGRTLDALWQGCRVMGYGNISPSVYAKKLGAACPFVTEEKLEKDIINLVYDPVANDRKWFADLNELFVNEPVKDRRTIKFALFQTILKNDLPREKPIVDPDIDIQECILATERLLKYPEDKVNRELVLHLYNKALRRRPRALIISFNYAQVLWILGQRKNSLLAFQSLKELVFKGELDPQRDLLMSHRYPIYNSLVPYHAYNMACLKDLKNGNDYPQVRKVLISTIDTYLATGETQSGELIKARTLLESALKACPENGAAAHLLSKVLFSIGERPEIIWESIRYAIELYPLYLNDLLPFGLLVLEKLGEENKASKLAERWAYFATRVEVLDINGPVVPDQTWEAASRYFNMFSKNLKRAFNKKRKSLV